MKLKRIKIKPNKILYMGLLCFVCLFCTYVIFLYSRTLLSNWLGHLYPIKKISINGVDHQKAKKISAILPLKKGHSLLAVNSKVLKKKILQNFADLKVSKISKKYPHELVISLVQIKEDLIFKINDTIYTGILLKNNKIIHYNLDEIVNKNVLYLALTVEKEIIEQLSNPQQIKRYIVQNNTIQEVLLFLRKLTAQEIDFFDCISLIDLNKKIIYSKNYPAIIQMKDFSLLNFTRAKYAYLYAEKLYQKSNPQTLKIDLHRNDLVKYTFIKKI